MKHTTPWLAALFTLTLTAFPASAEIYRWVDEEGAVQFTQIPPPGSIESTTVKPKYVPAPAPPEEQDGGEPDGADNSAPEGTPSEEQPVPDPRAQQEQARLYERNCLAARKNLEVYQHARRTRRPDGTIEVMTDELRQRKEAAAREQIAKYCR